MTAARHRSLSRRSRGFTLIEAIIVMVLLALAMLAVGTIQGNVFHQQSSIKTMQVGTRLMHECAEQVIGVRRFQSDGFSAVVSPTYDVNACGGVPALSGFTIPTVTITDPYTGTACPSGFACKTVSIQQGTLNPVTIMLVDF